MKNKSIKNLDVLFINPPFHRFLNESNDNFPLGLGYLVSCLNQEGFKSLIYNADYVTSLVKANKSFSEKLDIFKKIPSYRRLIKNIQSAKNKVFKADSNSHQALVKSLRQRKKLISSIKKQNHFIWKELQFVLSETNPKIVGISAKMIDIPTVETTAKLVKKFNPNIKVFVGGAAPSTDPEKLINNKHIDYLVLGEGEISTPKLVKSVISGDNTTENLCKIKGIAFKNEDKTIKTKPVELITVLDSIPLPDRESMFVVTKNNQIKFIIEGRDVLTSRGCPYTCKFCSCHSVWNTKKARIRSNQNIIDELNYLYKTFDQKNFMFWDDLFTINRAKIIELCNLIKSNNLDISWTCLARLNTIDTELLEIMKSAGCKEIAVGIESGNDRVLGYIGKKLTVNEMTEKIKLLEEVDVKWLAFYIVGFPTETIDEIKDTISLMKKLNPTHTRISYFSPFPGSKFYNEIKENPQLCKKLERNDIYSTYHNFTGTMTDKEYEKLLFESMALNS